MESFYKTFTTLTDYFAKSAKRTKSVGLGLESISRFSPFFSHFQIHSAMVDEAAASASEASVTELAQTLEPNQASIEATVGSAAQGGAESSCNNNNAAESAVTDVVSEEEREKTLEFADELTEKGSVFLKEMDFAEAVDCFSRALEIRYPFSHSWKI